MVVANVRPRSSGPDRSLASLVAELEGGDQVVWVDLSGNGPAHPVNGVDHVDGGSRPSRGHLYARGLEAARHRLVGFTDSTTEVQPGWRAAVVAGLATGAGVVGGPVLPRAGTSLLSAAGFFVEYGPHAVAPFTSDSGDVSANNLAYRRGALEQVVEAGEPLWKSVVNARLSELGQPPVVLEAMRAVSTKGYDWSSLGPGRFCSGRLYGTQRSRAWPRSRRLVAALGCSALPGLSYARLARRIGADPALHASFAACTPLVVAALSAWSAGEAWGYLMRDCNDHDVF